MVVCPECNLEVKDLSTHVCFNKRSLFCLLGFHRFGLIQDKTIVVNCSRCNVTKVRDHDSGKWLKVKK